MRTPLLLFVLTSIAHADPDVVAATPTRADVVATERSDPTGSQLVYAEVLGKAGPYGVGYEHAVTPRVALGFEGSYTRLRSQDLATGVPYVHVTPLRRGAHALFGELGLELSYSKLESAVPRWMGTATTAIGGVASVGYERAWKHVVVRGALSLLAGKGGMAPWAGLAIGVKP